MTSLNEWIDEKIKDDDINYFKYEEFNNMEKVGEGGFGIVKRADWKLGGIKVALKILSNNASINEKNMKVFLKELKILRKVNVHPNINKFLGITEDPESKNYMIILKYANQGNLREYLENKFESLQWSNKIKMALDIARGLMYLHSRDIIHRDLHSKNILAHNDRLMIADLGLSKQLAAGASETSNSIKSLGVITYIEPKCIIDPNYPRNKESDIYGLGVLLWEITSGKPPFSTQCDDISLAFKIIDGDREKPIIHTPQAYVDLYEKCWNGDPNLRPKVVNVLNRLEEINSITGNIC